MKVIEYIVAAFLSIGVIRLTPQLINHINEGYAAASLVGEILAILLLGALEAGLFDWKKKNNEPKIKFKL